VTLSVISADDAVHLETRVPHTHPHAGRPVAMRGDRSIATVRHDVHWWLRCIADFPWSTDQKLKVLVFDTS
jgi:hypothetical protein